MAFAGLKKDKDRYDLIAHLKAEVRVINLLENYPLIADVDGLKTSDLIYYATLNEI
jgi:hypothetical protein